MIASRIPYHGTQVGLTAFVTFGMPLPTTGSPPPAPGGLPPPVAPPPPPVGPPEAGTAARSWIEGLECTDTARRTVVIRERIGADESIILACYRERSPKFDHEMGRRKHCPIVVSFYTSNWPWHGSPGRISDVSVWHCPEFQTETWGYACPFGITEDAPDSCGKMGPHRIACSVPVVQLTSHEFRLKWTYCHPWAK